MGGCGKVTLLPTWYVRTPSPPPSSLPSSFLRSLFLFSQHKKGREQVLAGMDVISLLMERVEMGFIELIMKRDVFE